VGYCYLAFICEEKKENLKNSTFPVFAPDGVTGLKKENLKSSTFSVFAPDGV